MITWNLRNRAAAARADGRDKVRQVTCWRLDLGSMAFRCLEPEGGVKDGGTGKTARFVVELREGRTWRQVGLGDDAYELLKRTTQTTLVRRLLGVG